PGLWGGLFASYLLIVSIYAFNSWAGLRDDAANPRLAAAGLTSGRDYAVVSALTLATALTIFAFLRPAAVPYALGIFFLWGIYSFPRYGAKYVPFAGTIVHVAVGMVQFQQGWALIGKPDDRSLFLSLYFALILAAGHVNHELIDHDADKTAGIASGAVRFGPRLWTALHLAITLGALCLLLLLSFFGLFSFVWAAPFVTASALQSLSAATLVPTPYASRRMIVHRTRYRLCFLGAGLAFLMIRLTAS
ncbi:MAG TPA: UbiA family prenyltransferase, partial [bacterium]|nr:UbiA family prenyltransferase [bacterium]